MVTEVCKVSNTSNGGFSYPRIPCGVIFLELIIAKGPILLAKNGILGNLLFGKT